MARYRKNINEILSSFSPSELFVNCAFSQIFLNELNIFWQKEANNLSSTNSTVNNNIILVESYLINSKDSHISLHRKCYKCLKEIASIATNYSLNSMEEKGLIPKSIYKIAENFFGLTIETPVPDFRVKMFKNNFEYEIKFLNAKILMNKML